ncbi:MAG: hypothetical protein COA30_00530 [Sulfurimonas sp.]|nr:MAG: hypothetical protein COA30_00530 [Sulfurimonas sp.]
MYRQELNSYFPLPLIQKEYREHLAPRLTAKNEVYTSNQDVENLLNNVALMKSIRYEIEENSLNRQHESIDVEYEDPKGKI